jgi:hypothetical protein
MRARSVLVLVGISGALAAVACQILAGIDDRSLYTGSGDAGPGAEGGAIDPCREPNVPRAPNLSTSSPSDNIEGVLALSMLHLGLDGGVTYGFNLDKACTCPEPDTCQRPASQARACDEEAGVDNAGRPLFQEFSAANLITESTLNNAIQQGLAGLFVRVQQYNGKEDDAIVSFAVYASPGFTGYPDAGPKFDGTDKWYVDQGSLTGLTVDSPKYSADQAYVSKGVLVASLNFPIIIGGANINPVIIELESGKIAAKLTVTGGKITGMSGSLAGRWPVTKMLTSLQNVKDPLSPGNHLCGADPTFQSIKPGLCNAVDITSDPTNDGTGICDAVSMGLGFEASPAVFGVALPTPGSPNFCDAGYVATCP